MHPNYGVISGGGAAQGGGGDGPPLAALLWGRHYGLCCRLQNCKGCIEIKVVLMSGHYLQLKDRFAFE